MILTIRKVIAINFVNNIIDGFHYRRKGFFIFGKNSSKTNDSTYAEIANQQSGDSTYHDLVVNTYQELTVSELDTTYHYLALH